MENLPKIIKKETAYGGKFRSFINKTFLYGDKDEVIYEILETDSFCTAFCLTPENKVLLIKKFMPGIETTCYGLPGGMVEADEDPEVTIKREVLEETGYEPRETIFLGQFPCGTYSSNYEYCFLMLGCSKVGDRNDYDKEILDVEEFELDDFKKNFLFAKENNILFEHVGCSSLSLLFLEENK